MARVNRTNPAYAYLAYRKAILQHTIAWLERDYTADQHSEPNEYIYSEDVLRGDEQVPVGDVQKYISDMEHELNDVINEMNQFEFRRAEEKKVEESSVTNESKEPQGSGGPATPPTQSN